MFSGLPALSDFSFEKSSLIKRMGCILATCLLMCTTVQADWAWNTQPPIPDNDARWNQFKTMWTCHWDGENLDDMIGLAQSLETDYPNAIEPKLWLGKLHVLKGKYLKSKGLSDLKKAEAYAVSAHKLDRDNIIAFKILIDALPFIGDIDYAMANHGEWIKKEAPLKTDYVIPPMTGDALWEEAIALWKQRAGDHFDEITPQGLESIKKFNALAEANPKSVTANSWACRVNYDIGQYYSSIDEHESKGFPYYNDSIKYGKRALALDPHYLPAGYWSTLSQARLIQKKSILTKAKYVNFMITNGLLGLREDSLYSSYGHTLALAITITNGGWAAQKGINMAGITLEMLINQLALASVVYPTKLYALYGLADIYHYSDEDEKAQEILDRIFSMDPDMDPFITLENRGVVRFARKIQEDIDSKRK